MSYYDDQTSGKEEGARKSVKPVGKRIVVADCEVGDFLEYSDGSRVVVTSWMNGGPFGRYVVDGVEGEICSLDPSEPITRISGYR